MPGKEPAPFPAELPALTSVRFLLALGVVMFHYHLMWVYDDSGTGLFERARLGVDVFFILSGFILTHVYREQLDSGRLRYRAFITARFARIYPMHIVMLLFMLVMVVAASLIGAQFGEGYSPLGFVLSLLMIQSWFPTDAPNNWNGPAWSLSAEWFAYLAFPVFGWIGLKLKDRPLVLLVLAVLAFAGLDAVYRAVFGKMLPHAEDAMGFLRIIPEFLYGVALYRAGQKLNPSRSVAVGAAVAATAAFLLAMHFKADDRFIVLLAGPLILALALLSKAGASGALARPWMLTAGEASFALYMVHMPVIIAWKGLNAELRGVDSSYRMEWPELTALFALILALALAFHFAWETPVRHWIRRRAESAWPGVRRRELVGAPGSQPPDY